MGKIRLNIDGIEVIGYEGQTILDIAREYDIFIPTLCHDERVKMFGSCGICVVEAEGNPRLLRACSTMAADGMVITTESNKLAASRRTALELLLSDHTGDCRPPCALACPAQTDCQGYVGLIAIGEYAEAYKLIKDKIPLPGSIGRVCPHPCEEACRRQLVEEPISIAALKTFAAEQQGDRPFAIETDPPTGKKVAIVGGGPGGLSAAYFLRLKGHDVTIYDAMPHMGGMLRYGIPEYRLPKAVLQKEIDAIAEMGVAMQNNMKIGRDITLDYLRNTFDAVILAVGAWTSMGLRCPGETLPGVLGGIDFLRDAALNQPQFIGRKVAVVGGGNTAMDACRTLVRLGAEEVYNIYRRTRAEMPAEEIEIDEAEEEGVIFKNLRNPLEIIEKDGRVAAVKLQVMELGEPDASGRRAPVAAEGQTEMLEVDTVVLAIGQRLDAAGLEGVELTGKKTIAADNACRTNLEGVFAIGDACNNGTDIAIAAIGDAKKAALSVDMYLNGQIPHYVMPYRYGQKPFLTVSGGQMSFVETELDLKRKEICLNDPYLVKSNPTAEDFADREKLPRVSVKVRKSCERKNDFLEINRPFAPEEAEKEAARCLECGCHDLYECKLIEYANRYAVTPELYAGEKHNRKVEKTHPFINRNPDKCILCGLCVRVCEEVVGQNTLGLVGRGFDTIVSPAGGELFGAGCRSCGMCVTVCPTGALTETMFSDKQLPVRESAVETTCSFCSVGCRQKVTHIGATPLRVLPAAEKESDALLCVKGRFGLSTLPKAERIVRPMMKIDNDFVIVSYEEAIVYANKRLQGLQSQYGNDCIAVTVSDRLTNEEALLIREYAHKALHTENLFSFSATEPGIGRILGRDVSTVTLEAMQNTDCILLLETDIYTSHMVAGLAVRKAAENGTKLIVMNSFDSETDEYAAVKLNPGDDLSMLQQMVKYALEKTKHTDISGFAELQKSLAKVVVTDEVRAAAELYQKAKNAVILFPQNVLSDDAINLLTALAVLSGQIGRPRAGILQLKSGANSQGLSDLGIREASELIEMLENKKITGLFVFGENVKDIRLQVDFLAVQELFMTDTTQRADILFPAQSLIETEGTFTNTAGKRQSVCAAIPSQLEQSDFDLLCNLSEQAGYPLPYRSVADVTKALPPASERLYNERNVTLLPATGSKFLRENAPKNTNALLDRLFDTLQAHKDTQNV